MMTRSSGSTDGVSETSGMREKPKSWSLQALMREVLVLGAMVLTILAFRSTFFSHYNVPTGSMIPTILPGDHFLANQMGFGLRIPFSGIFLSGPTMPARGDIVVFPSPTEPGVDLVKRVVALGGEILEVRDGLLFINGAPIPTEPVERTGDGYERYVERMPDRDHVIQLDETRPLLRNYGPIEIPKDSFFPMGDNRDHSADGRAFGPVSIDQLRARAMFILYSVESFPTLRWDRTGHTLYELPAER